MSHAKSRRKIIELYGLPGGGKTTFAKELSEREVVVIPNDGGRLKFLTMSLRYPLLVFRFKLLILKNFWVSKSFKILRYDFSLLFSSLKKLHDAKRHAAEVVVVDEGLMQRLLSCSYVEHSSKLIEQFIERSLVGDVLVNVNHREVERDRYSVDHVRMSKGGELFNLWQNNLAINLKSLVEVLESSNRYADTRNSTAEEIARNI